MNNIITKSDNSLAKRALALLLSVVMVILTLPMVSHAAPSSTVYTIDGTAISNVYYETLVGDFLANITADGKKTLKRDGSAVDSGFVKEGDVLDIDGTEYTISFIAKIFDPMATIKDVADGTVLHSKAAGDSVVATALVDYGFYYLTANDADFKNSKYSITKGSTNGVPYYEFTSNNTLPMYLRGNRMSDYRKDAVIGKYLVLEMEITPQTVGGFGLLHYFHDGKTKNPVNSYFGKGANSTFMMDSSGNYGLGGYMKTTAPYTNIGTYTVGTPLRVKMYTQIYDKSTAGLNLVELNVNGTKVAGPIEYENIGTGLATRVYEHCIGIWSPDGKDATARFSNVNVYIADTYPSLVNTATVTAKAGSDYDIDNGVISNIPYNATAEQFLANLIPSSKATVKLTDALGNEVSKDSSLSENMKVVVTSADASKTTTYTLSINEDISKITATISGTEQVGYTLTAHHSTAVAEYEGCPVTYRWLISDAADGDYTPIDKKTESTLYLDKAYYNKYIRVEITPYIDSVPMKEALSVPTGAIADPVAQMLDQFNESKASNIETNVGSLAEVVDEIKAAKATLNDYQYRLACLDILKGIPYNSIDEVTTAFEKAAKDVLAAANDTSELNFEGYDDAIYARKVYDGSPVDTTPAKYTFAYGDKEFIVLDADEDNVYVLAKDYYGTKIADENTERKFAGFDATLKGTLGYFLNNEFVASGNGGSKLPDGITKYIDYSRVWKTEPISGKKNGTKTYGGIGLLSMYEFEQYCTKIGADNAATSGLYWSRTPSGTNVLYQMGMSFEFKGATIQSTTDKARHIRPTFWLDKSFFEANKITSVGSDVALTLAKVCDETALEALYTEAEFNKIFPKPYVEGVELTGLPYVGNTLSAKYTYPEAFGFKEDGTTVEWLMADTFGGSYTPTGVTGLSFEIGAAHEGKYIKLKITPKSECAINTDGDAVEKTTSNYIVLATVADDMASQLSQKSGAEFTAYLNSNDGLFMSDTFLAGLTTAEKELAIGYLDNSTIATIAEYEDDMHTAVTLAKIKSAADASKVEGIIKDTKSPFNKEAYMGLEDKTDINDYMVATPFVSTDEFVKNTEERIVVTYFNNATREDVVDVLDKFDSYLTKDISSLDDDEKETLGFALLTDTYETFALLNAKVTELYPTSSGSGGGGSGNNSAAPGNTNKGDTNDKSGFIPTPVSSTTTTGDSAAMFNDMYGSEWAVTAVHSLAKKGIINGVGNGKFAPEQNLTREQFAKILVEAFDLPVDSAATPFKDVSGNEWYAKYVAAAYKNGIVLGVSADRFGIGEYITKEQMATLIYRTLSKLNIKLESGSSSVKDINSVSSYAKEAVKYMSSASVITGDQDGNFSPTQATTRAMAAVVIYRTLENMEVAE